MTDSSRETSGDELVYSAEEARKSWAELLSTAQYAGKHITITRSGKRAAVLVPADWYDRAKTALNT